MADLRLQVIMTALDKITGPLKKIQAAASPTAKAIKATSDRLKELGSQQKNLMNSLRSSAASKLPRSHYAMRSKMPKPSATS
ncbi:hypothetical protein [Glaciimonas immobilis]|uniref:Uncharacterized protein n=1 Tax=Glaciimonas immobilis TaxID=728004 RepID=A0A840RQB0_9BURK|nr:hypothetical protein [Glaciimonas immobilis]KAF3999211.1 hypothetical protein HAV38_04545 [Glaciimonas immobilis]MBB5198669.1 hypothetical protein [Glaciimonas immobilis]